MTPQNTRLFDAVVLVGFCVLIAVARWHTYTEPADWDIGTYAVIGHELNAGQSLYSDIWDVKPPLVYVSYALAERLTGYGFGEIYLLAVLTACGTMVGIWYAARTTGPVAGLIAAAAYTIVSGDLYLEGNRANTEAFINLFLVWGIAVLFHSPARLSIRRLLLIGGCFAVATCYKQVAIAPIITILAAQVCSPPLKVSRRAALRQVAVIFAVVVAAWLALFGYFAATGRGGLFWITAIVYPHFYGGSTLANLFTALQLKHLFPAFLYPLLPCAMLSAVALVWPNKNSSHRQRVMLLAMMLGAYLAIGILRQFFEHYYQFWFIPLCIGSGWGAAVLLDKLRWRPLALGSIALALGSLAWVQSRFYEMTPKEWSNEKNGLYHTRLQPLGLELNRMLAPGETFFDWSENNAWLYFATKRRPPGPGLWSSHLREGPMAEILTQATLQRLGAAPPKYITQWVFRDIDTDDNPIASWIMANYEPVNDGVNRWPIVLWHREK